MRKLKIKLNGATYDVESALKIRLFVHINKIEYVDKNPDHTIDCHHLSPENIRVLWRDIESNVLFKYVTLNKKIRV